MCSLLIIPEMRDFKAKWQHYYSCSITVQLKLNAFTRNFCYVHMKVASDFCIISLHPAGHNFHLAARLHCQHKQHGHLGGTASTLLWGMTSLRFCTSIFLTEITLHDFQEFVFLWILQAACCQNCPCKFSTGTKFLASVQASGPTAH